MEIEFRAKALRDYKVHNIKKGDWIYGTVQFKVDVMCNPCTYKLLEAGKIAYSKDYHCPKCGAEYPDEDYSIKGEEYPKYYNQHNYYYGNVDWTEVHRCPKCKTLYYFENGD